MKQKKKIFAIILILITFCSSCKDEYFISFAHVDESNNLFLVYQNDNCGEWGGDVETIKIYRRKSNGKLYADYFKEERNCKHPPDLNLVENVKNILLSEEDKKLILSSINELIERRFSQLDYPQHYGNISTAYLSDSSLTVSYYPSEEWTRFVQLKKGLKSRKNGT